MWVIHYDIDAVSQRKISDFSLILFCFCYILSPSCDWIWLYLEETGQFFISDWASPSDLGDSFRFRWPQISASIGNLSGTVSGWSRADWMKPNRNQLLQRVPQTTCISSILFFLFCQRLLFPRARVLNKLFNPKGTVSLPRVTALSIWITEQQHQNLGNWQKGKSGQLSFPMF